MTKELIRFTHFFFPAFYQQYPKAKYYGTPRHLRRIKDIPWAGSLWDCKNRALWPGIKMRIPRGSEFVDPEPEATNHFSGIHVYHQPTGVLHVDDTINVIDSILAFHPSIATVGLYHVPEAVSAFRLFIDDILNQWTITTLCAAHKSVKECRPNAAPALAELQEVSDLIVYLPLEAAYALYPNATQGKAFKVMEAHENKPLCISAGL